MNSVEQDERQQPTDGEYVLSSRNGCPDHFRLLVQRYQKPLFAYLSSRLGNPSEAEEAAQESFVRAFLSLKKLRKPESLYAWLMGIAGRVLKEQFRAQEHRRKDRAIAEHLVTQNSGGEPEDPFTRAALSTGGRAKNQIPISLIAMKTLPFLPGGLALSRFRGAALAGILLWVTSAGAVPQEPWLAVAPTGTDLYGVTFGSGQFVAVGDSGMILTSTDGANWVVRMDATNQVRLFAASFGPSGFVAVGGTVPPLYENGQPAVWTSPDGIAWTPQDVSSCNLPYGHWLQGVTYGRGLYVAVGGNGATHTILTSPDGIVWTMRDSHLGNPGMRPLAAIAYGNGVFVAGGKSWLITSPDGIAWTPQVSGDFYDLYALTFAAGRFVGDASYNRICSMDGTNWTVGTPWTGSIGGGGVTYGDGYFVCTDWGYPSYTTNGTDWIAQTNGFRANAVAYGNSVFVAVAAGGIIYRTASSMHLSLHNDPAARLTLTALVPSTCYLESSSNLADANGWSPLATIPLTNSPAVWTDWSSTNVPKRFYRAVWTP